MKKIFVIFISLGFLQCANTPKVTSELLNGNWFYCNDDGYNEIYINKNNLIWSNEDFPSGVIYNYEIKGDSLITTTPRTLPYER